MNKDKIEIINGIANASEKALNFVEKILADPFIEGTGIFTDKVKYWRFKNQIKIILKAKSFLKSKGIETPKKIPIKDLTTLLEYASFEEEEKMQENWANLLANSLNPKNTFNATHIFSQVLNQISFEEIQILKYMLSRSFILSSDNRPYFEKKDLIGQSVAPYELTLLLFDNLLRLRIIEEKLPKIKKEYSPSNFINDMTFDSDMPNNEIISSESIRLSKFGTELLRKINL